MRAPFPYYGSKRKVAALIEELHGPVNNLVIPFAGSLGELLGRSAPAPVETVNDLDGFVVNAWRAMTAAPDRLAELCDHPVHEVTLHAAHDLLLRRAEDLADLVRSDPEAFDVELAAWWIWGASCWIGGGWCRMTERMVAEGQGQARRVRVDGRGGTPYTGRGVARPWRQRPHLSHRGQGIARQQMPMLSGSYTGHPAHGQGVHSSGNREALLEYFVRLADRLRWVRITCGDWRRVVTPSVTTSHGVTAISLDPPYEHDGRSIRLYREDDASISSDVRAFAIEAGEDPLLRITLHGRGEEHDELLEHGWSKHVWRDRDKETIWASPRCTLRQASLF